MGKKGMRVVNNKCGQVVILWQQVRKPGQLTERSIVYPSPTPQEPPVIKKQSQLLGERWLRTGTLGFDTGNLQRVAKLLASLDPFILCRLKLFSG